MFIQTTTYVLNRDGSVRERGPRGGCVPPTHVKSLLEENNLNPKTTAKRDANMYCDLLEYYMNTPEGQHRYQWDQISRMLRSIGHEKEELPPFFRPVPGFSLGHMLGLRPRKEVAYG